MIREKGNIYHVYKTTQQIATRISHSGTLQKISGGLVENRYRPPCADGKWATQKKGKKLLGDKNDNDMWDRSYRINQLKYEHVHVLYTWQ